MRAESFGARSSEQRLARRGLTLCILTVIWNIIEGVIAVAAGISAESIALLGFGIDSFIETASAAVVGWRFSREVRGQPREATERAERRASRIAGSLLLLLALYIVADALRLLLGYGDEPEPSLLGIILTAISLAIMPLLGRAKLKTAQEAGSRALRADGYESISCAWLSLAVLTGLILNATLGWWWADPLAALALVPLILREGVEALRGDQCGCDCRAGG